MEPTVKQYREPIAIVGSSCRFPGNANTAKNLWQMLKEPPDLLQTIPNTRFNTDSFYHPDGSRQGCTNTKQAYLLSEPVDRFDATFFNINPREAEAIDPQQRMLLEVVYEAMEAGGFTVEGMRGSDTAVYVGCMTGDYAEIVQHDPDSMPQYMATGTASSIISNRVSYFFDWTGPSETINTACSSSLVAVHHAVQTLREGECKMAVAGGTNLILSPYMFISESKLKMLSPTGRSHMWDDRADGYARGEGFSAIVMKKLSDALADGDHIECIIRETAVNQDGRTKGITMPSAASQTALIRKTYERAGLDWHKEEDRCQYFEAHGTGTQTGDVAEARGLAEAFFDGDASPHKLYVGSIKTVIGHLEGSAGMAGLLKASLALQHVAIPPNLHFLRLNPTIEPYYDHLEVPTRMIPWPTVPGNTRRASVNSFGFGGTNAHIILESAPEDLCIVPSPIPSPALPFTTPIVLSAMSERSLAGNVRAMRDFLQDTSASSLDLENLAWSLQARRSHFPFRVAFSGISKESIITQMTSMTQTDTPVGTRMRAKATPYRTLAIFTGQGAQWATMGRELLLHSEAFSTTIASLDKSLQELPDPPQWSIRDELCKDEGTSRLGEAEIAQPVCTALQIALVDLATIAGIKLDAVIGHSSGEIAAAYAVGALSARDALCIAYYRGVHTKLARGPSGQKGAMMAVGISFEEAERFCSQVQFQGRINVAAVNSPSSMTVAGDEDAIFEAKSALDKEGTFARVLRVDRAYHSSHMMPCAKPYADSLRACGIHPHKFSSSACAWYSSVHRRAMGADDDLELLSANYWVDNMTSPVFFAQALQKLLQDQPPFDVALEFGPHPALKGPVLQTAKEILGNGISYQGILHRGTNDVGAFSTTLAFLWSHVGLSAENISRYRRTFRGLQDWTPEFVPGLPGYCWDHRQSFWSESRLSKNYRTKPHPRHALLGRPSKESTAWDMRWKNILRLEEIPWLRGHRVQGEPIFPAAGYLIMALEAAKQMVHGKGPVVQIELLDVHLIASIDLDEDMRGGKEIQFTLKRALPVHHQKGSTDMDAVEAEFACYSCIDQNSDAWETNIYGKIRVTFDGQKTSEMPKRDAEFHSLASIHMSNFYAAMDEIGLNYSGLFRGLTSIQRKMGFSTAVAALSDLDVHDPNASSMPLHPALLDSCFQALFAAYAWPGDGSIQSPFVPTGIQRIQISSPFIHATATPSENKDVIVDAYITESSSATVRANLNITPFGSDKISVLVEGLVATCLVPAGPQDDREVFSETVWEPDISSGVVLINESPMDVPEDLKQIEVCERLAYYYLRSLKAEILPHEITASKWHHQRLFEFMEHLFAQVDRGEHATLRRDWAHDTEEELAKMKAPFASCVDVQLTTAVGKNLPRIVRGEVPALEVMLEDNMLDRIYKYGIGFPRGNRIVSRVAQQITHRHANMDILEIGAGTGGATSILLRTIGHSFASYTFSDISAGFFEHAQTAFKEYAGKMKFKTLDIEGDMAAQGFADHSFDAIVASNVLHATKSLKQTLHNVRRLLKPGGYLMLLEVTSEILRIKLMMSGLPGWWLGGDDDRRFAPTISAERWDSLLRATGFSGVDTIIHDMNDASRHMTSVMVSQAVSDQVSFLRNPTTKQEISVPGKALIIGGATSSSIHLVHEVSEILRLPGSSVLPCLERIASVDLSLYDSVLCLTELDQPIFASITGEILSVMQKLFDQIRHVLWITSGCRADNPYANMSVGLGRSLPFEFPQLQLQFLDVGAQDLRSASAGQSISESFLRFVAGSQHDSTTEPMVWTNEPELVLENGKLWIPRIMGNKELNDRLNSRRRVIKQERSLAHGPVEFAWVDGQANLLALETTPRPSNTNASHAKIQVRNSLPYALRIHRRTALFLCEGIVVDTGDDSAWPLSVGQCVIALSDQNASTIEAPVDWIFPCSLSADNGPYLLHACATALMASQLDVEDIHCVLIHNSDPLSAFGIQSVLNTHSTEVVWTTTDPSIAKKHGWMHVSPHCTGRELTRLLPSNLDVFWDLSAETCIEQVAARIRASLPADAVSYFWNDFYRHESHIEPRSYVIQIGHLFAFACRNLMHLNPSAIETSINILPVQNIWTTQPLRSSRCVIRWNEQAELPVRVQPANAKGLFRLDRTYFLVGCTGGLGLSLCRWMVENGARYLVVTSRDPTKVDPKWTQEIRDMSAEIHLVALDISDKPSLYHVYEEVQRSFPPVAGVANAAMVLEDRMFSSMSLEDLTKVLRPKVDGTKHLDELFGNQQLDFFVLFSSTASVVGNRGQSNYAAANLFMAGLANQRRKKGLAASVIDIGMVLGVGYITENGIFESKLKRHNLMPISESEFHNMFVEAIAAGKPDSGRSIQLTTGLHRASRLRDGDQTFWADNPRFSHFFMEDDLETQDANSGQDISVPVRQLLQDATTQDQHVQILQDCFLEKLGRILQVQTSAIEPSEPLVNLGVDSLMAVEVRTWFFREVGIDVPVLKVLGGSCVIDLCKHASDELYHSKNHDEQSIPSSRNGSASGGSDSAQTPDSDQESPRERGSSLSRFSDGLESSSGHSRAAKTSERDPSDPTETTPPRIASPSLNSVSQTSPWVRIGKMSYAQRRLWFLIQFIDDVTTHNVTMGYRITGELRTDDLQEAFQRVIQRHESLRACFFADEDTSEPMQAVLCNGYFAIDVQDGQDVEAAIESLQNHHYALGHGETLKALLLRISPDESYLVLGFSHLVLDGFSAQILIQEVQQIYTQPQKSLALPPQQYLDFALRQSHLVENGDLEADILFWKAEFPQPPPVLPLFPFASVKTRKAPRRYDTHSAQVQLDADCVGRISRLSKAAHSTSFSFYLTILQVLLFKFLDKNNVCIGIVDANRNEKESLGVIGFFVNLLPVPLHCDATDTINDAIQRAEEQVHNVLAHSRLPFDVLLDSLGVTRSATETPMFQVLLDYQKGPAAKIFLGNGRAELHYMQDARTGIDLALEIKETPGRAAIATLRSQKYLYDQKSLNLLLSSYRHMLQTASEKTETMLQHLTPFSVSDRDRALKLCNSLQSAPTLRKETVPDLIYRVCQDFPNDIALRDGMGKSLRYAELGRQVGLLATELVQQGVQPRQYVVVFCEPSFDSICSILAVQHIGAVYVPVDARSPRHRIETILTECSPAILIHDQATFSRLQTFDYKGPTLNLSTMETNLDNPTEISRPMSQPDSLAYVIYTSGSTGKPKGVLVTHANLVCQLDAMRTACHLGRETLLQQSSLGFDASIDQIFDALTFGGTLVLVPASKHGDMAEIAKIMAQNDVTMTQMTPSEYSALLAHGSDWLWRCRSWRHAFCGGESFTTSLREQFRKLPLRSLTVYNRYGPTEITVSSCFAPVSLIPGDDASNSDIIPCGTPLDNYTTYILDEDLKPVPLGYPGEICIGGGGVTQGYLHAPEMTRTKFVPNPFASPEFRRLGWDRLYRTGDKGLLLEDGSLVLVGRVDGGAQVKINGRRTELEEISSVILQSTNGVLADAAVSLRKSAAGTDILFAIVAFISNKVPDDFEQYCRELSKRLDLPEYMCPTRWAHVNSLPRNSSGKLDRGAINQIPVPTPVQESNETLSEAEGKLAGIWAKVLHDSGQITGLSDFFQMGGNSILLLRLRSTLREEYDEIPGLADLFANSKLSSMAVLMSKTKGPDTEDKIDWENEAALPEVPLLDKGPLGGIKQSDLDVVLTGATGFLGSEILQLCIRSSMVKHIHCVAVRNEASIEQLRQISDKVIPYRGDLRQLDLGLDADTFSHLEQHTDLIIHSAADVSFLKSYDSLREPNVHSTRVLLRMAIPRRIPFHFVSTGGVASLVPDEILSERSIAAFPPSSLSQTTGYIASKWVSECMAERVSYEYGIPVHIHRPASITGPGAPLMDIMQNILHYSEKLCTVPQLEGYSTVAQIFDFIPVESVAEGIMASALQVPAPPSFDILHHCSDTKLSIEDVKADLEKKNGGAELNMVHVGAWIQQALAAGMPDLVASMIESVLQKQSQTSVHVLVKGK